MSPKKKALLPEMNKQEELEFLKQRLAELESSSDIRMDELIPVMSLINFPLNLSTKERGQGDIFRFEEFGSVKRILYSKLLSIMEVHSNFLNWGYFLILDERVIKSHGLQEKYKTILTKEKIVSIISGSAGALELYKSCSQEQQKIIVSMMVDKLKESPDSIDLNLVEQVSRLSGVKILDKAEESRQLFANKEA